MKHVILNTKTGRYLTYQPRNTKTRRALLECPTAELAQITAEHFTRRTGVAHFARTITA